jgi:hypothetical protein
MYRIEQPLIGGTLYIDCVACGQSLTLPPGPRGQPVACAACGRLHEVRVELWASSRETPEYKNWQRDPMALAALQQLRQGKS